MANHYPIALRDEAVLFLLTQAGQLDRKMRAALEQQIAEQVRIGLEAEAAERVVAAIYLTTLTTADETLTIAELIKATRWPLAQPALAALDRQRREEFLKRLNDIADRANEKVVSRFNR
jgi:hypothetical protein